MLAYKLGKPCGWLALGGVGRCGVLANVHELEIPLIHTGLPRDRM